MKEEYYKEIIKNLTYNQETGVFTWKENIGRRIKKGSKAGHLRSEKYISIGYKGKNLYAHRIAWYFIYKEIPKYIDHINGDGTDNKIKNLRSCTLSQNSMNRKIHSNNKTGYKGIYYAKDKSKYRASIMINGKKKHIGYFETAEEASEAYANYAKEKQGEFYREL